MKNKKLLIIVIISIVLLFVAGGFAYVFFATDILKSDEELFYKYLSKIISEEEGFIDENIRELQKKKKQTPYENSGNFKIVANLPEEIGSTSAIDKLKDLSIDFSGKSDSVNGKKEQEIKINYGNNVEFPIVYKQIENIFGVQIKPVSSKYVAFKNENLKDFAQKLGMADVTTIPDKIEFSEIEEDIKLTKEEKEQLKKIYSSALKEQLTKNNFAGMKTSEGESYTLQLNGEQLKNLIVKLLETTKQNTLLLDKVNEYISQVDKDAEDATTEDIDKIIANINDKDSSEILDLKITLTQKKKRLTQIVCEYGNDKLTIAKVDESDKLAYNINLEIQEKQTSTETEDSEDDSNTYANSNPISSLMNDMKIKLYINMQYTGLQELNSVQEKNQIGLEFGTTDVNYVYEYNIEDNIEFKDSVSIEDFGDNSAVVLNNYNGEVLTKFLSQLAERILLVNREQMQELGLKEIENPLIYSNPITMLTVTIFNSASNVVDSVDLSEQVIQTSNEKFVRYEGTKKRGAEVNALLITVIRSNIDNADTPDKQIEVKLDGNKILSKTDTERPTDIDLSKLYDIKLNYSDIGYVSEIDITANN